VELTLASIDASDLTVYDRRVSRPEPEPGWPMRRIVVLPLVLFAVVSAGVFTLAKLHLAKPEAPASALSVALGNQYRGETVFVRECAGCHGEGGAGGGIGPRLVGAAIPLPRVKAQIDQGGGAMPAGLVSGQEERDVLAYLATILGH
jgi:mono/diheme cytochrome c family protein